MPRKHGGGDEADNLASACIDCNLAKGTNLTGIDPATGATTLLFNPRRQEWSEHFEWHGATIVGKSAISRTTVVVLQLNAQERVQLRLALR